MLEPRVNPNKECPINLLKSSKRLPVEICNFAEYIAGARLCGSEK